MGRDLRATAERQAGRNPPGVRGLFLDWSNRLYARDANNNRVRMIELPDDAVTRVLKVELKNAKEKGAVDEARKAKYAPALFAYPNMQAGVTITVQP